MLSNHDHETVADKMRQTLCERKYVLEQDSSESFHIRLFNIMSVCHSIRDICFFLQSQDSTEMIESLMENKADSGLETWIKHDR